MTAPSLLLSTFVLAAQVAAQLPAAPSAQPQPRSLQITILEGEGALNDVRQRTAREPIVEVDDENHRPVSGALILFQSPGSGASGTFQGATTAFHTVTAADGRAVGRGFTSNHSAGSYQIQVTATYGALTAQAVIHESNFEAASTHTSHAATHGPWVKVVLITAAVAGAVTGIVLATQGSSTSAVITPGTPVVGPTTTARRR